MKADEASASFFLVLGGVVAYLSKNLGLGDLRHFGPGFLPFWSGVFLCFSSIAIIVRSRKTTQAQNLKGVVELWSGMKWSKPIIVIVALLVYTFTFAHIGFIIGTMLFLIIMLRAVDPVRWTVAIFVGTLTSFACFVFFDLWLKIQLPKWILEMFLYNLQRAIFGA
jgi:putative tricarboxylic transport membrane protein